jgi:hypothetical protein
MTEWNNGGKFQFRITRFHSEAFDQIVKTIAGVLVELKNEIERRGDKDLGHVFPGQRFAQDGMFKYALFNHVVLPDDHGTDLTAIWRDPEKSPTIAHRHGPLPFGAAYLRNRKDGGADE